MFLFVTASNCLAEEVISYYHSDIEVLENSELLITETIRVKAEGREIKRGIYRDFPTDYRDDKGNRIKVGFDVLSVKRNGSPEPYHTQRHGNGIRVYVGDSDVFIPMASIAMS